EAGPLRAIVGRELRGALKELLRLVLAALAHAQQTEAANRLGVIGSRLRGARQQRSCGGQIVAREQREAALLRDVIGIGFDAALGRVSLLRLSRPASAIAACASAGSAASRARSAATARTRPSGVPATML